jgi:hypothetical protein
MSPPVAITEAAIVLREVTDSITAGAAYGALIGGTLALLARRPREDFPQVVAGGAFLGGWTGLVIHLAGHLQ